MNPAGAPTTTVCMEDPSPMISVPMVMLMLKRWLCDHDFRVQYLDSKFHMEMGNPVWHYVCKCPKCGKVIRVPSGKKVL